MIDYLIKEPVEIDRKKGVKYPFITSEIFTADLDYLVKSFFEDFPVCEDDDQTSN